MEHKINLNDDTTEEMFNYLSCEDVINLKKSDYLSDVKLRQLVSKKILNKMMKQYPNLHDKKLNDKISRFCFSSLLSKFTYDIELTSEQINKMISILTVDQLEKVNDHLNKSKCWY